jgi:hypothetical protein
MVATPHLVGLPEVYDFFSWKLFCFMKYCSNFILFVEWYHLDLHGWSVMLIWFLQILLG